LPTEGPRTALRRHGARGNVRRGVLRAATARHRRPPELRAASPVRPQEAHPHLAGAPVRGLGTGHLRPAAVRLPGQAGHGAGQVRGPALASPFDALTARTCHSPSMPLSRWTPRSSNERSDPTTRSRTVLDTRISPP